jgi:hypothetical protein
VSIFTEMKKTRRSLNGGRTAVMSRPIYVEEFDIFQEEYEAFIEKRCGYEEPRIKQYFDAVQANHKEIRKLIGGLSTEILADLPAFQKPASLSQCRPHINIIKSILPGYLENYEMTDTDLLVPTNKAGMKIGKHINAYISKYSFRLDPYDKKNIDTSISKLGELWSQAKTEEEMLTVRLDTSAMSFVRLGHYGPDNVSCFRQTSENPNHKFDLGRRDNTFVILIRRENADPENLEDSKDTHARLWGFYKPLDGTWNFCNYYANKSFMIGNAQEACRLLASHLLGIAPDRTGLLHNSIQIRRPASLWHNKKDSQPNWTFFDSKKNNASDFTLQTLE